MKNTQSLLDNIPEIDHKIITGRIIHLRNDILQMTQSEFAATLNVSQSYLSLLENGSKPLTSAFLENVALTFKLNLEWLLMGIGTDDDIFLDSSLNKDYFKNSKKLSTLSDLQNFYHLKDEQLQFVKWLLELPDKERSKCISAFATISEISSLYPPESF